MSSEDSTSVSAAEKLHPEINGLLQQMDSAPMPSIGSLSPNGSREVVKQMFPTAEDPTPVGDVMDLKIGDTNDEVGVRVYVPEGDGPYPALIYIHGGGWVVGNPDLYDATCRALTNEAECMVVSVDYRLAPEHKFPTPLEDCYTAVEWLVDNASSMQVDTDNVAIGGDSSGGNLAAAVAQLARDRDGPTLTHQTLIYPVTDYSFDTASYDENAEGYLLTKADMKTFWDMYLQDEFDGKNPYASPLQARDLEDLPSTTVVTCGFDPLRDEGAAYAKRLEQAGVNVNYIHYDDAIHGIAQMLVEPMVLTRAEDLIGDVAVDLKSAFE